MVVNLLMINFYYTRPIVFIDIESTGINPKLDRIIEISMIKIYSDGNEESLNFLINPTIPIPFDATEIHGITDSDVSEKPRFEDFAKEIFGFIDNCDLGGFAIKRFDLLLLEEEFSEGRNILFASR